MTVSAQDRAAMARLIAIMQGETPPPAAVESNSLPLVEHAVSPRGVSTAEVNAMADLLRKLDSAVKHTTQQMVMESVNDSSVREALNTTATSDGVKIGIYRIQQQLDEQRVAGKQFYNVINQVTGDVVANELSLFEAAHSLVRMLNNGLYFNSEPVRKLMEAEAAYTSHKIDAVRYHRMMRRCLREGNNSKAQLMETRKQNSMDKAMMAKSAVKKIYQNQSL